MDYSSKVITAKQAVEMVKNNDTIVFGSGVSEPQAFMGILHEVAPKLSGVTLTECLPLMDAPYYNDKESIRAFNIQSWFFMPVLRKYWKNGNISHIPGNLSQYGKKRKNVVKTNFFVCAASMPDSEGNVTLGLSNLYEKQFLEVADKVILEINPKMPTVKGDHHVNLRDADYIIEADYQPIELLDAPSNEKDKIIGKFIADMVNDGDCVQVGIGGIPNAVCNFLLEKKDLGIHTEMMTTGVMRLMQSGAVSNKKKQVDVGKSICTFIMGTRELYDYVDNNDEVAIYEGCITNDPAYIEKNDNQVSINTCIEIDLTGQCCSETIGTRHFSGSGGQCDTAVGALRSKNGRSFIALYSTTTITDKATGEKKEISKIVPTLKEGACVTLSRNDVDYVVTEYGVAWLRGQSVDARVRALVSIAHPKFRDELMQKAREFGYLIEK